MDRVRQRWTETEVAGTRVLADRSGALSVPSASLLAVADLHLEKGAAYARRGVFLPPYDTMATLARLEEAVAVFGPATLACLGDSFHDREGADAMPAAARERLAALVSSVPRWIWVSGNHDPDPPRGVGGEAAEGFDVDGLRFRHVPSGAFGEIAGHLHPCARVTVRGATLRRRCFVTDGRRMVMPAFGSLTGSLDVADPAFDGLVDRAAVTALMVGAESVYAVGRPTSPDPGRPSRASRSRISSR